MIIWTPNQLTFIMIIISPFGNHLWGFKCSLCRKIWSLVPKGFLLTPEKRHIDLPPTGTLLRVTDRGALLSFVFGNDSPIKMIFWRKKLSKNTSQNEVRSKTSSSYLLLKKSLLIMRFYSLMKTLHLLWNLKTNFISKNYTGTL